jgi:PTH1 family peptidyl-tRNA hydrolase
LETPVDLIVGLGNPGPKYHLTRHNAGADLLRELANGVNGTWKSESKFFGETCRLTLGDRDIRLLIPSTFMNLSGQAVSAVANFYQIPAQKILIVHDELDLQPGTARFKIGGGHGGHNGLRDIVYKLGNNSDFTRLRIGIGHPGQANQVSDYVLKKPSPADQRLIANSIQRALEQLPVALDGDWEKAMTALHTD